MGTVGQPTPLRASVGSMGNQATEQVIDADAPAPAVSMQQITASKRNPMEMSEVVSIDTH